MRILVVGDLHGKFPKNLPKRDVDLILLTGDLGKADLARRMAFENIERKRQGLKEKNFSHHQKKVAYMQAYNSSLKVLRFLSRFASVYFISGNVEYPYEDMRKLSNQIGEKLPTLAGAVRGMENVRVINNQIANFKSLRIGGLEYFVDVSWVREFKPSDYKEKMRDAKKQSDKAREILRRFQDVDILLCHQPPHGILDKVSFASAPKLWKGKHAGSKIILDYVQRKHPRYVFCGHIHEAEGMRRIGKTEVYNLGLGYKVIEI